jgi:hypothetical protein
LVARWASVGVGPGLGVDRVFLLVSFSLLFSKTVFILFSKIKTVLLKGGRMV